MEQIIQLIRYQKKGEMTAIVREIPADTRDEAIDIIKAELREKLQRKLEDELSWGYTFEIKDTYHKGDK